MPAGSTQSTAASCSAAQCMCCSVTSKLLHLRRECLLHVGYRYWAAAAAGLELHVQACLPSRRHSNASMLNFLLCCCGVGIPVGASLCNSRLLRRNPAMQSRKLAI
jgi:hypothetical protein